MSDLILGIETSCDETAVAVVADGRYILAEAVASQVQLHAPYGGVYPELASRQHMRDIVPLIRRALADSQTDWQQLEAIAVTYGPGLPGALLVGVNVAKGLALATGLPLIGVSHLEGHLYSNWLRPGCVLTPAETQARPVGAGIPGSASGEEPLPEDPAFPHLALIVSGGHTELVHVRGHGAVTVLGSTLDDAAGEAFDKAARLLGLGYPGGPAIEQAARAGDASRLELPVAVTDSPFDFSFSGLKTALARAVASGVYDLADLAAAFQSAVVRALTAGIRRALNAYPAAELHLAGGVSANGALRRAVQDLGVPVRCPPLAYCTDNGAMTAAAGYWARRRGRQSALDLDVVSNLTFPD